MNATQPANLTIRDLAQRFPGYRIHQIKYAVEEYGIDPRARCGIIRLWSEEDIARIAAALKRIAGRRGGM